MIRLPGFFYYSGFRTLSRKVEVVKIMSYLQKYGLMKVSHIIDKIITNILVYKSSFLHVRKWVKT